MYLCMYACCMYVCSMYIYVCMYVCMHSTRVVYISKTKLLSYQSILVATLLYCYANFMNALLETNSWCGG